MLGKDLLEPLILLTEPLILVMCGIEFRLKPPGVWHGGAYLIKLS